jgi:hypothetical protein
MERAMTDFSKKRSFSARSGVSSRKGSRGNDYDDENNTDTGNTLAFWTPW